MRALDVFFFFLFFPLDQVQLESVVSVCLGLCHVNLACQSAGTEFITHPAKHLEGSREGNEVIGLHDKSPEVDPSAGARLFPTCGDSRRGIPIWL